MLFWNLQTPTLVSHFEKLDRQLKDIEGGIYDSQLELEVNLDDGETFHFLHCVFLFCHLLHVFFALTCVLFLLD